MRVIIKLNTNTKRFSSDIINLPPTPIPFQAPHFLSIIQQNNHAMPIT